MISIYFYTLASKVRIKGPVFREEGWPEMDPSWTRVEGKPS